MAERSCTHLSESYAWILTSRDEVNLWLTAPTEEAMALQTPLANRALRIVARGNRQDGTVRTPAGAKSLISNATLVSGWTSLSERMWAISATADSRSVRN